MSCTEHGLFDTLVYLWNSASFFFGAIGYVARSVFIVAITAGCMWWTLKWTFSALISFYGQLFSTALSFIVTPFKPFIGPSSSKLERIKLDFKDFVSSFYNGLHYLIHQANNEKNCFVIWSLLLAILCFGRFPIEWWLIFAVVMEKTKTGAEKRANLFQSKGYIYINQMINSFTGFNNPFPDFGTIHKSLCLSEGRRVPSDCIKAVKRVEKQVEEETEQQVYSEKLREEVVFETLEMKKKGFSVVELEDTHAFKVSLFLIKVVWFGIMYSPPTCIQWCIICWIFHVAFKIVFTEEPSKEEKMNIGNETKPEGPTVKITLDPKYAKEHLKAFQNSIDSPAEFLKYKPKHETYLEKTQEKKDSVSYDPDREVALEILQKDIEEVLDKAIGGPAEVFLRDQLAKVRKLRVTTTTTPSASVITPGCISIPSEKTMYDENEEKVENEHSEERTFCKLRATQEFVLHKLCNLGVDIRRSDCVIEKDCLIVKSYDLLKLMDAIQPFVCADEGGLIVTKITVAPVTLIWEARMPKSSIQFP